MSHQQAKFSMVKLSGGGSLRGVTVSLILLSNGNLFRGWLHESVNKTQEGEELPNINFLEVSLPT